MQAHTSNINIDTNIKVDKQAEEFVVETEEDEEVDSNNDGDEEEEKDNVKGEVILLHSLYCNSILS